MHIIFQLLWINAKEYSISVVRQEYVKFCKKGTHVFQTGRATPSSSERGPPAPHPHPHWAVPVVWVLAGRTGV